MQNTKHIYKILTGLLLLISLLSVSDFTPFFANNTSTKTELLLFSTSFNKETANYVNFQVAHPKKIIYNKYLIFNFKCFLNTINFEYSIHLKTQKQTFIEFTNSYLLDKNLVALQYSDESEPILLK